MIKEFGCGGEQWVIYMLPYVSVSVSVSTALPTALASRVKQSPLSVRPFVCPSLFTYNKLLTFKPSDLGL